MGRLAYIKNFFSKISGKEKMDDEEIKKRFNEIIDECENDKSDIRDKREKYRNQIRERIYQGEEAGETFKRSHMVKEMIIDIGEVSNETKKIISLGVIDGYFAACKLFMEEGETDSFINSFENGVELYNKYPDKAPFRELLDHIDFKTGPLSVEDIKKEHLYYEELYEEKIERLKIMLFNMTGVFGISGSRGTGKSTLLHVGINEINKRTKIKSPLVVELTVPSEYKTEEQFLTVLLSNICEKTIRMGGLVDHLMNICYKLRYFLLVLLVILFILLYEILSPIFLKIDYEQLISVTEPVPWLMGLLAALFLIVSIVSIVFISKRSHTMSPRYIYNHLHVYFHVNRIYNDIKFIKTSEITRGAGSQYLSFSRRTTFQENPINYSTPLLSDKIKELIQEHVLKIFDKVIIIIDDFDKLVDDERACETILKSIRFLSSTKDCSTFIAVPEKFEYRLKKMNSEVRTLFDQFIILEGIEDEEKLRELIKHRIMTYRIGEIFLRNLIDKQDKQFYTTLRNKSKGIPREAIRSFNKCFQDWLNSRNEFIDKSLLYDYLFSWDKIPGDDTERLREFLKYNFLFAWVKSAKIEKIDGDKAIKVSTERNSLSLRLNDEETKVNLEINGVKTYEFTVKTKNGALYEDFEEPQKMLV